MATFSHRAVRRFVPCVLAIFVTTGCGRDDGVNRQAVFGHVSLATAPVEGMIEFSPLGGSGLATGAVITAGEYVIPADKGLPPGEYQVRIYSASNEKAKATLGEESEEAPGEIIMVAKEKIPPEYNSQTSQVRTVEAGKPNRFDFEIPAGK